VYADLIYMQWLVSGFCIKTKKDSGDKVFINVCQGASVSDFNPKSVKSSVTHYLLKVCTAADILFGL